MKVPGLRSSYERVGGLVFFGRMLDKIRLHALGRLPSDYNHGTGSDLRCTRFLRIEYPALVEHVLQSGTDEEVLEWCFQQGRRPTEEEIEIWSDYMSKRGWRDNLSEWLANVKKERGFEHRHDIQTAFDFHKADEED
jgi:gluconokinase